MIALWIVYATVVAGVVGLAGWAVERVLRAWNRPSRHVWALALLGSLLLPAAVAMLPFSAAPPAREADAVAGEVSALLPRPDAVAAVTPAASPTLTRAVGLLRPLAPHLASLDRSLGTAWVLASGTALLLLLLGVRAMARRRAGWRRRTVEGRPVLVAPDFGPAVVGVRRPEIVVPEWALRLERRLLQLVLLHEDQHRRAGDTVLLTAGVLAVAAAPWNPFLWWQLRRLRLAVEMDCDCRVLRRGVSRVAYGRLLLEVGRRQPQPGLAVAALAEPKSTLERRIRMITTRGSNRSVLRAALALTFAALLVVVACETPTPTALSDALEEAGMTVEEVVTPDGNGSFVFPSDVFWVLDGVLVSEPSTVTDFDPKQIERIEIVKGEAAVELMGPRAGGIVFITTKDAPAESVARERLDREEGPDEVMILREISGERGLRIRGIRDITARPTPALGATPLVVVDGVITDLTLDEIDALDIKRIEILKGDAARTLVGDRGADDRVIHITTGDGS